jgi:hypothetical protein
MPVADRIKLMCVSLQPSQDSLRGGEERREYYSRTEGLDNKFYVTLESYLSSEFPRLLSVSPASDSQFISYLDILYRRYVC